MDMANIPVWGGLAADRDAFLARVERGNAIMGILNVTPDSFSDGGRFDTRKSAIAHAERLAAETSDIIDIGAESTRPGYVPISKDKEWARLAEIIPAVRAAVPTPLSIDTMKASIARRALAAGACVVNDIWGLQGDPQMASVVAETGAGIVVMHNRHGTDEILDVMSDLHHFFDRSLDIARQAGIPEQHIVLDPGIGFGKTQPQNVQVLRALHDLHRHGRPILVGVSRKSLFGALFGVPREERLPATIAANLDAVSKGARVIRVHDVREHRMALNVALELAAGNLGER